ncbi:MAG: sensor histidine kinase [Solirubrobacteraceae bacterium]
MSGIAEDARTGWRRTAPRLSEVSISLTVCLAIMTGVVTALQATVHGDGSIALPVVVLGAGTMFGVGLVDIAQGRELRFARGLLVAGTLWSVSALTASAEPVAFSIGHVSLWLAILAVDYLVLSYPTGRLAGATERDLFSAGALLIGLLFVPTALVGQFPHPTVWEPSTCSSGCPQNAFSLVGSTPAVVADVIVPLREVLAVVLFAAIAVAMVRRAQRAESPLGQLQAPIAAFAVLQVVVWAVYFPLRAAAPASSALWVVSWIFVLSFPAVAVACATGRLYQRIHVANVLDRMTRVFDAGSSLADLRCALADVLEDRTLRILYSFPGDSHVWVDESGSPVDLERAADAQRVLHLSSGKLRIAVLHDVGSAEDGDLVIRAGSRALAALEKHSLADELSRALRDLAETRASRLTAEQDTRQKIERDLHDGAQQRLVALRVKLGLAAATLGHRDPVGAEALHALEADVDATIDEVRALARGIYPPLLSRTGLRDALRDAARGAALPTTVCVQEDLGRYPAEIETTVYFSCSEALQNAAKHASEASGVTISVRREDHTLSFEVRDDGAGFDPGSTPYGTGLANTSDRLAAVGGRMAILSAPGQGTVLTGTIPITSNGVPAVKSPGAVPSRWRTPHR